MSVLRLCNIGFGYIKNMHIYGIILSILVELLCSRRNVLNEDFTIKITTPKHRLSRDYSHVSKSVLTEKRNERNERIKDDRKDRTAQKLVFVVDWGNNSCVGDDDAGISLC